MVITITAALGRLWGREDVFSSWTSHRLFNRAERLNLKGVGAGQILPPPFCGRDDGLATLVMPRSWVRREQVPSLPPPSGASHDIEHVRYPTNTTLAGTEMLNNRA